MRRDFAIVRALIDHGMEMRAWLEREMPRTVRVRDLQVLEILRDARLADRALLLPELADKLERSQPRVVQIIHRLERAGHVERLRYRHDKRVRGLRVSDAGLRVIDEAGAHAARASAELLGELTEDERDELFCLLVAIDGV